MKLLICLVIIFGSSNICFSSKTPTPPLQEDTLFFDLNNAVTSSVGDVTYLDLPVYIKSVSSHFSFDFWFKFNESKLTFDLTNSLIPEIETSTNFNTLTRYIQSTSCGPSITYQVPNLSTLVMIRFILNNSSTSIDTSDFYDVNSLLDGIVCPNKILFSTSTLSLSNVGMNKSPSVNIFPNPSNGSFYINCSEEAKVELFDFSGKELLLKTTVYSNFQQEIENGNFPKGIYYLKVYNENFNYTEKIVFQ